MMLEKTEVGIFVKRTLNPRGYLLQYKNWLNLFTLDFSFSAFNNLAVVASSLSLGWTWRLPRICQIRAKSQTWHYKSTYEYCTKAAWEIRLHHAIPHPVFLEQDTGIMVDLYKSLDPTQSHSFWAGCGDELLAASNNSYPSDSSSIWFTSQRAHRWGINVPSALPPLLLFSSKRDYFPLHFLKLVYLPLIFGQMHYFPSPRALLVSH